MQQEGYHLYQYSKSTLIQHSLTRVATLCPTALLDKFTDCFKCCSQVLLCLRFYCSGHECWSLCKFMVIVPFMGEQTMENDPNKQLWLQDFSFCTTCRLTLEEIVCPWTVTLIKVTTAPSVSVAPQPSNLHCHR